VSSDGADSATCGTEDDPCRHLHFVASKLSEVRPINHHLLVLNSYETNRSVRIVINGEYEVDGDESVSTRVSLTLCSKSGSKE